MVRAVSARNGRFVRPAVTAALAVGLVATLATPAEAVEGGVDFNVSAKILHGKCTPHGKISDQINWKGGFPQDGIWPKPPPKGHLYICRYKFRLKDDDPHGDYYAAAITTVWTYQGADISRKWPAQTVQSITSDTGSKHNVFGSTAGYTSDKSCSDALSFSLAAGPVSASYSPQVCNEYKVRRVSSDARGAIWRMDKAGGLKVHVTTFVQKVPEGSKPKYDFVVGVPRYKNHWDQARQVKVTKKHLIWKSWSKV